MRKRIAYSDLLREIRQGLVHEIAYFDSNNAESEEDKDYNTGVEGYCLVVYKDGGVAQVNLKPGICT